MHLKVSQVIKSMNSAGDGEDSESDQTAAILATQPKVALPGRNGIGLW
jgi:hypothetical protein